MLVAEVVQGLHAVDIDAHAFFPEKGGQLGVTPAVFMSRHIKGNHPHLTEGLQRLKNRRLVLIQLAFLFHLLPPHEIKNASREKHSLRQKSGYADPAENTSFQKSIQSIGADSGTERWGTFGTESI